MTAPDGGASLLVEGRQLPGARALLRQFVARIDQVSIDLSYEFRRYNQLLCQSRSANGVEASVSENSPAIGAAASELPNNHVQNVGLVRPP